MWLWNTLSASSDLISLHFSTDIQLQFPCSQAFPPSSFSPPTVCNNGGGRPGPFIKWMTPVSTLMDRGGEGVPNQNDIFHACVLSLKQGVVHFSLCKRETLVLRTETTRNVIKQSGSLLPSVYLGRYWRHSYDKMDRAFLIRFYILCKLND